METMTHEERFVLYVMKNRKNRMQAISKIAKTVIMDKEELRKILISLKDKDYLYNQIGRDKNLKWIVK